MSEDEIASLNGLCKSKTPGLTGTKVAFMYSSFHLTRVFDLLNAIVNSMLTLGLIPEQIIKITLVACIPKPTSGFRPLPLYEEVLKAAEATAYSIQDYPTVRAIKKVGTCCHLSGMHAAYGKGRAGTYYVLTINACALEDPLDRHEP